MENTEGIRPFNECSWINLVRLIRRWLYATWARQWGLRCQQLRLWHTESELSTRTDSRDNRELRISHFCIILAKHKSDCRHRQRTFVVDSKLTTEDRLLWWTISVRRGISVRTDRQLAFCMPERLGVSRFELAFVSSR